MRVLILGSAFDSTLRGVAQRLRARHGTEAVQHRTLEDLVSARWAHRLGTDGVRTDLTFVDGATLAEHAPNLVFNRLEFVPTLLFARMAASDRDYARTEFHALLLSWLASLGNRVVNRATPSALAGPGLRAWQWAARAADAGLLPYPGAATTSARRAPAPPETVPRPEFLPAVDTYVSEKFGFDRPLAFAPRPGELLSVLVLGERVVGDGRQACGATVAAGCVRLARAVGAEILAVQLARVAGDIRWRFVTAEPRPRLTDEATLDALTDWLEART